MIESYGLPSRYSDFSPLGSGGIGTVFKAVDSRIDREIALKILNNVDSDLIASIEKEFSTLATLKHPYLIQVYDFGQSESGHSYFTMDYINGPNLSEYFDSPEKVNSANDILMDILEALDYLAKKGIIHGDIKPDNILVTSQTTTHPVLVDFGLSTITSEDNDKLFGTPRFLAPEILSSRQYSIKSDFYALGHTFIESLIKIEPPISSDMTSEYLDKSLDLLDDIFSKSNTQYPRNLASYILRLSDPSLEQRPDTTSQAIQMLSTISHTSSTVENLLLSTAHIVREDIDNTVNQFIEGKEFNDRVLILDGPTGVGKKSLMSRAISKAQLLKYKVLYFENINTDELTLQDIIDVLSIILPVASSKELSKQHKILLNNIKKAEATQDLDNLGVIYSNIIKFIHDLSKEQPVLVAIPNIDNSRLDTIRFITHLTNDIDHLKADIKVLLSYSTDIPQDAELNKHLATLTDEANILVVRGFNSIEVKYLTKELFGHELFADVEIESILSFTDGIPTYILDYFNFLLANDIIKAGGRKFYVDHKQIIKTYSTGEYSSMANSITSNMTSNELHALQLLSSYNQAVDVNLMNSIVSYDLVRIVNNLAVAGLIKTNSNKIQIKSPKMKNHLSHNMSADLLTEHHRTLAEYTILADIDNCSLIAKHFIKANAPEDAFAYAVRAHDNHLSYHEYYSAYNILSSLNNILDEIDNVEMKIAILEKLSSLEFTMGHYDDALTNYHKLVDMSTDDVSTSGYYISIGRIERYCMGDAEKSLKYFNLALDMAQQNSAVEAEAQALFFLGMALKDVTILEKAADLTKDTMPLRYVMILSNIMFFSQFSGLTDKCLSIDKELDKYLSSSDPAILSEIYDAKHMYAFFTGNYPVADKLLHKLIDLTKQSFNEVERTKLLNKLGGLHYVQGHFNKQIDTLEEAYNLVIKYHTSMNKVNIFSNLALAHFALANYSSALRLIEEIKTYTDKYFTTNLPTYHYSIGAEAYMVFGELYLDKYHEYSDLLETLAIKTNNKISLGHMNIKSGSLSYFGLEFDNSEKYFSAALELFTGADAKDDMLESLLKLSLIQRQMNNHEQARDYAKQAAKIFREINCGYLKPLYSYVAALSEVHDNPDSLAPMLEAIDTSKAFGTREWTWQIQFHLARLYKEAGDISNSVKYCRESINTLKEITESFDSPEQISSYLQVPLRSQVFDFVKSLRP